jgi:cell division protein FtsN
MRRFPPSAATPRVRPSRSRHRGAGGTLVGVFIGLVLGIVIAGVVGLYITGGWKAYQQQVGGKGDARDRETVKSAKSDSDRPRFDFYKILPGGEEPKVAPAKPAAPDRSIADRAAERSSGRAPETVTPGRGAEAVAPGKAAEPATGGPPKAAQSDRFWLQAGSFASEADAENLRARLALAGWEAQLQQGTLPDKGVRYRVRLGPYDNADELNRVKGELARRGFDVAVIRY